MNNEIVGVQIVAAIEEYTVALRSADMVNGVDARHRVSAETVTLARCVNVDGVTQGMRHISSGSFFLRYNRRFRMMRGSYTSREQPVTRLCLSCSHQLYLNECTMRVRAQGATL